MRVLVVVALIVLGSAAEVQARGVEVSVPMTVKGMFGSTAVSLVATQYVPEGDGRFPAVVISHGVPNAAQERGAYTARYPAASAEFVKMGFVVLNPLRRGYGKTGGTYAEDHGNCRLFAEAGLETSNDIAAAVDYLRRQPFVDPERIVLVGQSGGGWGSLAAATRADAPIRGVVNFAGGRGGKVGGIANNNCQPEWLIAASAKYGKAARVPSLWLYAENDHYFAPDLSRRMYAAYTEAGAKATFVLLPAFGEDGHGVFAAAKAVPLWRDRVTEFLREIGVLESAR